MGEVKYMCQVAKKYTWVYYVKHNTFRYVKGKGQHCSRWKIHRIYLGTLLKKIHGIQLVIVSRFSSLFTGGKFYIYLFL